MKPRERVEMSLRHETPDRCPLQISFTPEFAARLKRSLGLSPEGYLPPGREDACWLERAIGVDMLLTSVGWSTAYYAPELWRSDKASFFDEWGVEWQPVEYETKFGRGRYARIIGHPLADEAALASYQPPDPFRPELYTEAKKLLEEFKQDYYIVGVVSATLFETAWALRGLEKTLQDMVLNPGRVEKLLDIPFNYHLAVARQLVELGVDMIMLGDDVGGQEKMIISPASWRRFLKPKMAEVISRLKTINPEVKVAYHSDGCIYDIIPDLIDIGVDALHPVQPNCLDPRKMKREFGQHLCLWGTIDLEFSLAPKTPAEVEAEVIERMKTVGEGGGLIIAPTHPVPLDMPLENFWATVNAVRRPFS